MRLLLAASAITLLVLTLGALVAVHMLRRSWHAKDDAWKPSGLKPMERTWNVATDHDDPRARRQLMAEVKARRVQAQRGGKQESNVVPIRKVM